MKQTSVKNKIMIYPGIYVDTMEIEDKLRQNQYNQILLERGYVLGGLLLNKKSQSNSIMYNWLAEILLLFCACGKQMVYYNI